MRSIGQTASCFSNWVRGVVTYNPGVTYNIVKPAEDIMIRVWTPSKGATGDASGKGPRSRC